MANLLSTPGLSIIGIQHQITAGAQFTGELPTVSSPAHVVTCANALNKFVADTKGGLFDFEQEEPLRVMQYHFDLGGSVAFVLTVETYDAAGSVISGESMQILAATSRIVVGTPNWVLGKNQKLKLTTSGAAAAMTARIYVVTARHPNF